MRDPCSAPNAAIVRAEREVVAAVLGENDLFDSIDLTRAHFTDATCQRVFAVATDMIERGERADDITVARFLTGEQRAAVADMLELSGARDAIPAYADLLRTQFQRRGLAAVGADMTKAAQDQALTPDKAIEAYQDRLDELRGVETARRESSIGAAVTRVVDLVAEVYRSGVTPGLRTGIADIDEKLHPMRPGQVIIVGGGTGQGKSVFGQTLAVNAAKAGTPSLIFSLEMKADDYAQRLIAGEANVSLKKIINGELCEDEFRALRDVERGVQSWPMRVETPRELDAVLLTRIAKQHIRKRGVRLVIVDHIGLMRGRGKNIYEQMSDTTRGLKRAALDLDIPLIGLAQINRENQKRADVADWGQRYLRRRPKKSDLRDSGTIENDADVVMLLHREEAYAADEEPPVELGEEHGKWLQHMQRHGGKIDIVIAKQRQGQQAFITCRFDGARFRIGE